MFLKCFLTISRISNNSNNPDRITVRREIEYSDSVKYPYVSFAFFLNSSFTFISEPRPVCVLYIFLSLYLI